MSEDGREQIANRAASTSGLYTLSVSKVAGLVLPIPPIELQNEFADFAKLTDKSKFIVQKQIEDLELQQKLAAALHENLVECKQKGQLLTVNSGVSDPAIAAKIEAYNEAYLEYTKISQSAGARNPIAVALRDQMDATLQAARRTLDNYRKTLDLQLAEQRDTLKELRARMAETVDAEKALAPLIREHKVKEELYMLLLAKEQENALALAIAAPGAKVLETAYGSNAPIAPRTTVFIAAGTVGGGAVCLLAILGIGMVVAFVVSIIAIKFLIGYIKKNDFTAFGIYRIVLAIIMLAYFGSQALGLF